MSKHRYRSENIKAIDWSLLSRQLADRRFVLAVDVAKEEFVAALYCEDHEQVKLLNWRHPVQTPALLSKLDQAFRTDQYCLVMESTGSYGDTLCWQLRQRGVAIYQVSPKRVHDAAEVYDGVPSLHDAKAAWLIGRLHWEGVSQPWEALSPQRRTLKALLAQLLNDQERQRKTYNRLGALLSRHWPELEYVLGLHLTSVLELLVRYGEPDQVRRDPAGVRALMKRIGGARLQTEKIEDVLRSAQHSLGIPCVEAERHRIQSLASQLLAIHRALRQQERDIEKAIAPDEASLRIRQVVGVTTAAVISACLGSPLNYPNASSYLKATGLNLKEHSSGKYTGQLKLTKRGPALVRHYLYWAALRLSDHDPVIKAWKQRKAQRDGGGKSKAITAIMRKLVKALWYVGRGETFDVEKLFDSNRLAVR